jgi:hypothetical protein
MRTIPHNHPFRILWNCIVLVGVLVFLFVITYRIFFGTFAADWLYYLLIALFVADIGMNFATRVKAATSDWTPRPTSPAAIYGPGSWWTRWRPCRWKSSSSSFSESWKPGRGSTGRTLSCRPSPW